MISNPAASNQRECRPCVGTFIWACIRLPEAKQKQQGGMETMGDFVILCVW